MNIEIFRLYKNGFRCFDATPTNVTWKFDSDVDDITENTIYFNSNGNEMSLGSKLSNVIIKNSKPNFLNDESSYISFLNSNNTISYNISLIMSDAAGLDGKVIEIGNSNGIIFGQYRNKNNIISKFIENAKIGTADKNLFNVSFTLYKQTSDKDTISFDGLYVTIYDIAGNAFTFTDFKDFTFIDKSPEDFADSISRLKLNFFDTYPANLFIPNGIIGKTSINVNNLNEDQNFSIVIGLENDSLGYLVDGTYTSALDNSNAQQKVDGIQSTGYVKAYAYLKSNLRADYDALIKAKSIVYGSLGKWITECETNIRKIDPTPFVPNFVQSEKYFDFASFFATYLNTMFPSLDSDCKIGILEKTQRIGEFKSPAMCENVYLSKFGKEYGSEININLNTLDKIVEIKNKYGVYTSDSYTILKKLNEALPTINMKKGTEKSFQLIFRILGLNCTLIPMYRNKITGQYFEEGDSSINDNCYLSSHFSIKLENENYIVEILPYLYDIILSIIPINRVLDDIKIISVNSMKNGTVNLSDSFSAISSNKKFRKMTFNWNSENVSFEFSGNQGLIKFPIFSKNSSYLNYDATSDKATKNSLWYFLALNRSKSNYPAFIMTFYNNLNAINGIAIADISDVSFNGNNIYVNIESSRNLPFFYSYLQNSNTCSISFAFTPEDSDFCYTCPWDAIQYF